MNFAKLFIPNLTSYELRCREDGLQTAAALTELLEQTRKPKGTELTVVAAPVTGYVFDATARDKAKDPNLLYKFEVAKKQNFFLKLFQPKFVGLATADPGSTGTTLHISMRLPVIPVMLINWSANLALFAVFGVFGSYLLLDDPTPVGLVFEKIAIVPLFFSMLLAGLVRLNITRSRDNIVDVLVASAHARDKQRVDLDAKTESMKVVWSQRTIATFISLFLIIGAAAYMHHQAWELWIAGKYQESESLCTPVLKMAEFALGKESSGAAGCTYYFAECSRCEGKLQQARESYHRALNLFQQNLLPNNPVIAYCLLNLGRTEEASNNYELALDYYLKAEKMYVEIPSFGPDCMWTARVLDRIAVVEMKLKRLSDAESCLRHSVKIDTAYRYMAGRSVAEDLNDLGVILFNEGKIDEAKKNFVQSLTLKKKEPVNDSFSVALTSENLSIVLNKIGEHKDASKLHHEALEKFRDFLKRKNVKPGAHDDARSLYEKVLSCTKETYEVPVFDTRAELLIDGIGRI
jgi:tetratricopeptide (TPR) repeat protein